MNQTFAMAAAPLGVFLILGIGIPAVRRALWNGARCAGRHRVLCVLPAVFALAYGILRIGQDVALRLRLDQDVLPGFLPPDSDADVAMDPGTWLAAAESLAAMLNCLVATFPLSAVCAAGFLINARGLTSEVRRALCRRFGAWGWLWLAGAILCAVAAVGKPVLFFALPEWAAAFPDSLHVASLVNALSFVFEYLLGALLQIGLVLVAYSWVRGLTFDPGGLLRFAVRRMGIVLKWSLVMIACTLALVHLPAALAIEFGESAFTAVTAFLGRCALAAAMIALATVQIRLILHNDSLRGAVRVHMEYMRSHGLVTFCFLVAAGSVFLAIARVASLGAEMVRGSIWEWVLGIAAPVINAIAAGWLLASWVCFYKSREPGARPVEF